MGLTSLEGKSEALPGEGRSRHLDWPDCLNARDLGGLPTMRGVTRSHAVVRSDSLVHLTPAGRAALSAYGVTTVIDLRSPAEVRTSPNPIASAIPIPLIDDADMRRVGEAPDMFQRYLMMLDTRPHAFREVFEAVADAEGAVVIHCFAGKDRTGLVAALMLAVAGVPDAAIGADFAETDLQLAGKYEEWIAAAPAEERDGMREELLCPPDRILGALDHVRRKWGGVEAYLEVAGMKPDGLDRLIRRLA